MTGLEALLVLPWQQHQLAPQGPGTTGGRAPLEEEREEEGEKTDNSVTEYKQRRGSTLGFGFFFGIFLLQETMSCMLNTSFKKGKIYKNWPQIGSSISLA